MADTTRIKKIIEKWYISKIQQKNKNLVVLKEKVKLKWGGYFECDVVVKSKNRVLEVHCLSVSEYNTTTGKGGSGKLNKIKADALMLLGIDSPKKILAFTGKSMYDKIYTEVNNGRFPKEIILNLIDISKNFEIKKIISDVRQHSIEEML
jgi:hypothetical protein